MNIKKMITVGIAGMAMGAMALDNVEVTDVKARQRYPWNGKVDIDFTLDSKATEPYQMLVEVYDNIGKTNLSVKSVCTEGVSVEANPCMVRTDTRRIVWDAAKDLPNGFKCTNVLVTCRDARLLSVSNLYCVIDLKTGAKEYLSGVPKGGWTDEHKTSKMVFRRIEAGSFMMGSPMSEPYRNEKETCHSVTLSAPYYIAVYELTRAQYAKIVGEEDSSALPKILRWGEVRGDDWVPDGQAWGSGSVTSYCWPTGKAVAPTSVAGKLRTLTKIDTIDLPTEAQWEFAARAETTTGLNTGYDPSAEKLAITGRYEGNVPESSSESVEYVGRFLPNGYGLYDMLGNVREWCLDAWIDDLGSEPVTDPIGNPSIVMITVHASNAELTKTSLRVVRGGGFYTRTWQYYGYDAGRSGTESKSGADVASCRSAARAKGYSCATGRAHDNTIEGVRFVFLAE